MARLSQGLVLVFGLSEAEVKVGMNETIDPAHILLGLCKLSILPLNEMVELLPEEIQPFMPAIEAEAKLLSEAFSSKGLNANLFRRRLRNVLYPLDAAPASGPLLRSADSQRVLSRAERLALELSTSLQSIHLLASVLELQDPPWAGVLAEMQVDGSELALAARNAAARADDTDERRFPLVAELMNQASARVLEECGRDLTRLAAEGKLNPVIGRHDEMRAVVQIILKQRKQSVILVGEVGVGKTSVVEGLARWIAGSKTPHGLNGHRVVQITMASLVSGTKSRRELDTRLLALLKETTNDLKLVLFLDDFHSLMTTASDLTAVSFLTSALARGEIRCIASTTAEEYCKLIARDPDWERLFQVVWIDEPTHSEAVEILQGLKPSLEEHHNLKISDEAILAAVEFSRRYLTGLRLPDKAIGLIDQTCARVQIDLLPMLSQPPAMSDCTHVGRNEIAQTVALQCRIPLDRLSADESERLCRIESLLNLRVRKRDSEVRTICQAIRSVKERVKNPKRPCAVLLFAGHTTSAKSELASALAECLFDEARRLIRCSLTEDGNQPILAKLFGTASGLRAQNSEGELLRHIRTNPYSVVMLEEIDLAPPDVLEVVLRIIDQGQLSDVHGRRTSFTESVIILTSDRLSCSFESDSQSLNSDSASHNPLAFASRTASGQNTLLPGFESAECNMVDMRQVLLLELQRRVDACIEF